MNWVLVIALLNHWDGAAVALQTIPVESAALCHEASERLRLSIQTDTSYHHPWRLSLTCINVKAIKAPTP